MHGYNDVRKIFGQHLSILHMMATTAKAAYVQLSTGNRRHPDLTFVPRDQHDPCILTDHLLRQALPGVEERNRKSG
jgi:hypothetical protein